MLLIPSRRHVIQKLDELMSSSEFIHLKWIDPSLGMEFSHGTTPWFSHVLDGKPWDNWENSMVFTEVCEDHQQFPGLRLRIPGKLFTFDRHASDGPKLGSAGSSLGICC